MWQHCGRLITTASWDCTFQDQKIIERSGTELSQPKLHQLNAGDSPTCYTIQGLTRQERRNLFETKQAMATAEYVASRIAAKT